MDSQHSMSVSLDDGTWSLVDRVAKTTGRTPEAYAADAIRRTARAEAEFAAFVREGIDSADRGELIPHEEVMAEIDDMIARHRKRCD